MLERLALTCVRRRRRVVLVWIAVLVAALAAGSTLAGDLRTDFTLAGSPSQEAADLLESGGFDGAAGHRGQVVFESPGGVDTPSAEVALVDLFTTIEAQVAGVSVADPFTGDGGRIAPDGTVGYAEVELGDVDLDTASQRAGAVTELRDAADLPEGLRVELGGEPFYDEAELSSEAFGLLAAVAILLVAFGSVLAMGLPIVTALFGIGVGMAIVMLSAHVLDIPDFAPAATAMITIGVGIDYALFLVTRYREELDAGLDPEPAIVRSVTTAGRAVLFAGTTVVIAVLGLLVVGVSATRSLAVAITAGVLVVMVASLTLLPALLGFVGRGIDRLSIGRRPATSRPGSIWYRWSRTVQRQPARVAALGLLTVVALSAPLAAMNLGFADAGNRPETDTARRAYDLVADGFGPGFNGPLFLAVDLTDAEPGAALRLADQVGADPGVATVTPPATDPTGDVAVIQVIPTTSPQAEATTELVHRLRDDVLPAVDSDTGTSTLVGGGVAAAVDFADLQADRMPLFVGVVLAVSFVVLTAVFRSIPVAAKAVVLNLLSISAAYGIVVAVFQWGWGADLLGIGEPGPIEAWTPMMMFAILFGLSMDYEVFLLSRIKEEYDRTGDNATAVADGLARTARLITAAAAIMIFVFGGFVLSVDRSLQLFGFGLAAAIFVDVTVVRLLLVPSTMELLGDRNWWLPRWLDRALPDLRLDEPTPAADGLERTPTLDRPPAGTRPSIPNPTRRP